MKMSERKASNVANTAFKQFLLLGLFFCSTCVFSETLNGKVSLVGKLASKAKINDVIVYFEPENAIPPTALTDPYQIKMQGKAYHPRVSAIPLGSEIRISNHDSIIHNAFSPSRSNPFDLGLYGKSDGKTHRFDRAGVVRIFCNVHYHMVAYVLVLDTPFHTKVDRNGQFSLTDLPAGKGRLIFWHERSKKVLRKITLPFDGPLNIDVPITKRRIPEHSKKSGKSYKKKRRRRRY
jgi:plastocyanin